MRSGWLLAVFTASGIAVAGTPADDEIERKVTAVDGRAAAIAFEKLAAHPLGELDRFEGGLRSRHRPKPYQIEDFGLHWRTVREYREEIRSCLSGRRRVPGYGSVAAFGRFLDQYALFLAKGLVDGEGIQVERLSRMTILSRIFLFTRMQRTLSASREEQALDTALVEIARMVRTSSSPSVSVEAFLAESRVENKVIPHPWAHVLRAIASIPGDTTRMCPAPLDPVLVTRK